MEQGVVVTKNASEVLDMKGERVMVCGATGFIGSHLVAQLLEQGYKDIHIISRTIDSTKNLLNIIKLYGVEDRFDRVNIHYGSITNFEWLVQTMEYCNIVFNCAAAVDFIANDCLKLIKENVTLAHLVGEAAVKARVKRIVHMSSIAALGVVEYPNMITEDTLMTTLKGQSPYAISKFYSENEMWRISEKGIEVIVVNPAVVLGIGDWIKSTSPQIISAVNKGVPFYPSGIMGYVMVQDVAKAMIALSACDKAVGERFIICSDNLNYKDIIKIISKGLGKSGAVIPVSDWVIKMAGFCFAIVNNLGIKTRFARSLMLTLITKKCYDGSKIKRYIKGFEYSNISEELLKTCVAFNKNNN